jgi:hypothetical protein
MSELSSTSSVDLKLREPPHHHQGEKKKDQSCHESMTTEERDRSAPAKSSSDERSIDDFEVSEVPRCVHETPCDLHWQAYLDFREECDNEPSQDRQTQPMSPDVGHGLASPSEAPSEAPSDEARSDRDDIHGESYSSREYVDESEDDDLTTGLVDDMSHDHEDKESHDHWDNRSHDNEDNGSHDNEDNESNYLDDDEDSDNETSWSDEAANEEEYDMEEIISKDHVSQRRMQRIEIDKNDTRTVVPVVDDNRPAQDMGDLPQCDVLAHASSTTSQSTVERLTSSPSTPKGPTSSRQHQSEAYLSRQTLFRAHYERSPSDRTWRTWITLSADPSYDEDVKDNEKSVRKRIVESFAPGVDDLGSDRKGFVYAFRDNELPLIKIGFTALPLAARKSCIERNCGFVKELTLVAAVKVNAYKQLEEIVHQDLAPHRVYFDCACGKLANKKGFARHHEYFQIDDKTAWDTLQFWGDFVEQRPWERDSHKDDWHVKLSAPSNVESSETHECHKERVKRWRHFFNILESSVKIITGLPTRPLIERSTATKRDKVTGTTKRSLEDSTPSKPPRVLVEDAAEEVKPPIACLSSPGPLKRSQPSEPASLPHVQDTRSTARESTFEVPLRPKDTRPASGGQAPPERIILQAKGTSNRRSVRSAEEKSSSVFPSTIQAPPYNGDSSRRTSGNTTLAASNGQSSADRVVIAQESLVDGRPSQNIKFFRFGCPPGGNSQITPTKSDGNANPKPLTERVVSATESVAAKPSQHEVQAAEPNPKTLLSHKQQEHAVTVLTSPLVQSAFELAKGLLAKEVRPLPARAISDDLWQLRWPLACSVAFALHSPHIPAGLSFLMWSVFLPLFVAELRGWTVAGDA